MSFKRYAGRQLVLPALFGILLFFLSTLTMRAQEGQNFQPGQQVEAMVSSSVGWQPCTVTESNPAMNYMRVQCPSGSYMLGRRDVRAVQETPKPQAPPPPSQQAAPDTPPPAPVHQPAPPSSVRYNPRVQQPTPPLQTPYNPLPQYNPSPAWNMPPMPPAGQPPQKPGFNAPAGNHPFQVGQVVDVLLSSLVGWQPCTVTENNPGLHYMRVRCPGGVYIVNRQDARPTQNPTPYQPPAQQRPPHPLTPPNTDMQPPPFAQTPQLPNPLAPQQILPAPAPQVPAPPVTQPQVEPSPILPPVTTEPPPKAPEKLPGQPTENPPENPPVMIPKTEMPPVQTPNTEPPPVVKPANVVGSWIMAAPKGDGKFVRCQIMSKVSEAVLRVNCNECEGQPSQSRAVNVANTKPDDPAWKPPVCKPEDKPKEAMTCNVERPPAVDNSIAQPTDPLFRYLIFKEICGNDPQCGLSFKTFPIQQEFVNKADRPGGLLFSQALEGVRMNPVRQIQYSVCRSGAKSDQTGDFICFQDPALGLKWTCKAPVQAPPPPPPAQLPPPPPPQTCPKIGPKQQVPNNANLPFSTPLMLLLVAEETGRFFGLPVGDNPDVSATIVAESGTKDSPVYGVRGYPVKTCQPQPDGTIRWVERTSIGFRCARSVGLQKWDCVVDDKYK